jgi:hypothetical protein
MNRCSAFEYTSGAFGKELMDDGMYGMWTVKPAYLMLASDLRVRDEGVM